MTTTQSPLQTSPLHTKIRHYVFPGFIPYEDFKCSTTLLKNIRIAIVGQTGAGKSNFISTSERVVNDTQTPTARVQNQGKEGTKILAEYLSNTGFQLIDTRGYFSYDTSEMYEFFTIFYGRAQLGRELERGENAGKKFQFPEINEILLSRMIHAVIFVIKANDPRLTGGAYAQSFKPIRDHIDSLGGYPVVVITHANSLTAEQRETAKVTAATAAGCTKSDVFFIENYTEAHLRTSTTISTDNACLEALQAALLSAETLIKTQLSLLGNTGNIESHPYDWNTMEVAEWLAQIGLKAYAQAFIQLDINGERLVKNVDEKLLDSLGMKYTEKKKFDVAVGKVREIAYQDL